MNRRNRVFKAGLAALVFLASIGTALYAQAGAEQGKGGGGQRGAQQGAPQKPPQGQAYTLEQAASWKAQLNTYAFSGLAFLTGTCGPDTFIPPGKVADDPVCGRRAEVPQPHEAPA